MKSTLTKISFLSPTDGAIGEREVGGRFRWSGSPFLLFRAMGEELELHIGKDLGIVTLSIGGLLLRAAASEQGKLV